MNMIPFQLEEGKRRLDTLTEFGVDIYLQQEKEAQFGQEQIPLWINDYGYSQQGLSYLIEKRKKWYTDNPNIHKLAVGDRLAVFSSVNGGGIGVVKEINAEELYYTLFAPDVVYRKKLKDIVWNEQNWRWETTGTGTMRKLE
jgi:hypothetical protein